MKGSLYGFLVCIVFGMTGCEWPGLAYLEYGKTQNSYCTTEPNEQCLTIYLGKLDNPSQYRVVMTTNEYSDTAPPYTGSTQIIPLSGDYTFVKPTTNSQRDPIILQPNQFNTSVVVIATKVKPASPLYFYLIQVSGNGYIPSGKPHITVIAEPR